MMKWNHLPVSGGIYAQHPKFLDDLLLVHNEDLKAQDEQRRRQQAKMKRPRSR